MKVLKGSGYTLSRLAGIMHEMWCSHLGRVVNDGDTVYATGKIKLNNGEVGLVLNELSIYYNYLPDIHKERLTAIANGDGWNDDN